MAQLNRSSAFVVLPALALITAPVLVQASGPPTMTLDAAQRAAGWTVLFDGTSLDAWRGYARPGAPERGWTIEDGALRVVAGGGGGDLITKAQYENFELALEWRVSKGANSGVMYRVTEAHGAPWVSGPEFQILDDAAYAHELEPDDSRMSGGLYALYDCAPNKVVRATGEYNDTRIVLRDGVVKHYLNGVKVAEADLDSADWAARVAASKFAGYDAFGVASVGHLCLQDHGNDVWFRNIRVRDLDAPMPGEIDLLAGHRLDQWTAHLRDEAAIGDVWTFDDDVLVCAGQPVGYVRTQADYTNYVLRLQWRFDPVTKVAGNSGVLVRMIGEDRVWPKSVEAQLQSGRAGDFWNIGEFAMKTTDDRRKGRNTKHAYANERPLGEWNEYEIIVDGDKVTLIVNDEVLNTAWNVKEVAGKICLQSEGVPIHFRNVRLAEID